MATIAIYANTINQIPGLIKDVKNGVNDFKSELSALRTKTLAISKSVCDLDDVISSVQASTQIQEQKVDSLENLSRECEEFISDVARIDSDVSELVAQRKEEFYDKYYYLKPECEKNGWEKFKDGFINAGKWCKEHWKQVLTTAAIIVGAALAIAAVLATGGVALVPLLTTFLASVVGITTSTAMAIATVLSLSIAGIAVLSTIGSSTLNIIDTWYNIDNPVFKRWQNALNIVSAVSNGLYSIGNIYNSLTGVSGKEFIARQKAIENGKLSYAHLDDAHPKMKHSQADYDHTRKKEILDVNRERNGGVLRSDKTGKVLESPQQYVKGYNPPANEAQIDHILAKSNGGYNSFDNAQVIERSANLAKLNSFSFTNADYLLNSIPDVGSISEAFKFGLSALFQIGENLNNFFGGNSK